MYFNDIGTRENLSIQSHQVHLDEAKMRSRKFKAMHSVKNEFSHLLPITNLIERLMKPFKGVQIIEEVPCDEPYCA
jgi:hypothetical protein